MQQDRAEADALCAMGGRGGHNVPTILALAVESPLRAEASNRRPRPTSEQASGSHKQAGLFVIETEDVRAAHRRARRS
jgi:hypothetical protein